MLKFPVDFIPEVCIYHNVVENFPCPDGLAAAWVVNRKFPGVDFIGWSYQQVQNQEYPDLSKYQKILVVDFSFDTEYLDNQENLGKRIIIVDHHRGFENKINTVKTYDLSNFLFNNNECGASLAWKLLFKDEPLPQFLKYIRDRDINKKEYPETYEIHTGMGMIGRSFNLYDQLYENEKSLGNDFNVQWLSEIAKPSLEKKAAKFEKYFKKLKFWQHIPVCVLNKSDIYLKTDMADFILNKFNNTEFCIILNNSDLQHIRLRSNTLNLFDIFKNDLEVRGHEGAISFKWFQGLEELEKFVLSKGI